VQDRVRIKSVEVLSDDWAVLKKTVLDYRRRDGSWETQIRQTYDRGDGAVILPYDPERGTVLLVKQFRFPAYVTGHEEPLIEACAGLIDEDDPETAIRREAEEELGYRLRHVKHLYTSYMSPGSLTERLSFFTADYSPATESPTAEVIRMRARTLRCWRSPSTRRLLQSATDVSLTPRPSC
jgi:nudix-type nucleoside diphosphatase (YffH/AdpP family)